MPKTIDTLATHYAKDAKFILHMSDVLVQGSYVEVMVYLTGLIKEFKPVFNVRKIVQKTVIFDWIDYVEFNNGCSAIWSGTSALTFNKEGKVINHSLWSDNAEQFNACVASSDTRHQTMKFFKKTEL